MSKMYFMCTKMFKQKLLSQQQQKKIVQLFKYYSGLINFKIWQPYLKIIEIIFINIFINLQIWLNWSVY